MRVLIANTFHYPRGGDATYALALGRLLEAHGHPVAALAMRHPENLPSPWETWFTPYRDFRAGAGSWRFIHDPQAQRAAARLIAHFRPDVVHLQHVHHHLTPSVIAAAERALVPVVWTVHDYELICPTGLLFTEGKPCTRCKNHRYDQAIRHRCKRDSFAISALAALEKTVHRWQRLWERIDRLICPSQFVAERLIEFGIAPDRVVVLPNFIDGPTPAIKPGQDWMYAGRLTTEKGLDVLLDASTQLPAHRLHIYGTGPLEQGLRRRAPPHVTFHGHIAPAQLAAQLAQTAIVAVPSLWWENQPFAVTEAQAAGRVVVASHVGGIPELIDDGHDGVLVPPGNADALAAAVRALFGDADLRQRLGRHAQERVRQRLHPDRHLQALLQHYRDLL